MWMRESKKFLVFLPKKGQRKTINYKTINIIAETIQWPGSQNSSSINDSTVGLWGCNPATKTHTQKAFEVLRWWAILIQLECFKGFVMWSHSDSLLTWTVQVSNVGGVQLWQRLFLQMYRFILQEVRWDHLFMFFKLVIWICRVTSVIQFLHCQRDLCFD